MKLIISPEKKSVDIYSELCRSPSNQQEACLFPDSENIEVPSWSQYSEEELISFENEQGNKENENPNEQEKECFKTVKKSEKKGCHCEKSHCLKKYCDCFKIGLICS